MGIETAVAAGLGAAGIGASLFGANKQAKAVDKANKTNKQIADEANRLNYQMWLESRGIGPDGEHVNTKLPRWASSRPSLGFRVPRRSPYSGGITAPTQ